MSSSAPALTQAAPPRSTLPCAQAPGLQASASIALADRFVQFLVAVIAFATHAMDQMVPRTKADHARLRRMRGALVLARAMLALFGGPRPPSAQPQPPAAPNPWIVAFNRQAGQPRLTAASLAAAPPPFPGALAWSPPRRRRLAGLAAPMPPSAHDPP